MLAALVWATPNSG